MMVLEASLPNAHKLLVSDAVTEDNRAGGYNVYGQTPVTIDTPKGPVKATTRNEDFLVKNRIARVNKDGNLRMMLDTKTDTGDVFKNNTSGTQRALLTANHLTLTQALA